MKLIVGLGNPGTQYARTRHNAGFMVVDRLVDTFARGGVARGRFNSAIVEATIGSERCMLMKPGTYMNRSGQAVGEAVFFYKLNPMSELLVVTDDMYLPVGSIRVRPGGGTAGHNGLEDIRRALGGDNYPRLRVGVNAKPEYMDQADYVLSRFTEEELPGLESSIDKAAQACEVFATKGLDAAMNFANAPPPDPGRPKKLRPDAPPSPDAGDTDAR